MAFEFNNLSDEERKELRDTMIKINTEARERWDDPTWRREMARAIQESINEGFTHENVLDRFAEVQRVGFDDRVFIRETRGLMAHWVARGGYIEASTLRDEVMELPRDTIGFHVTEMTDKLRTNFAHTQANLIDLGQERLSAEVNKRVIAALQAAIPSTSDSHVSVSGLSLTSLNTAVREVKDEAKSSTGLAIVGRSTMTEQIIDAVTSNGDNTGFLPETNESILNTGVLGRYRGVPVITLINYKDDNDVSFFPGNELYVVARDTVRAAFFGDVMTKEFEELDAWYWHYISRLDFGLAVIRPERIRRIVDSTVAA